MSESLKNCPFCGSNDIRVSNFQDKTLFYAGCMKTGCKSCTGLKVSYDEAVNSWNTRVEVTDE